MRLLAVELHDFRNLGHVLVEPHPRLTVLAGQNGQGKTNFLEGIYLVGTLRPFRAGRAEELVRWGAQKALARARVERKGLERLYEVVVSGPPWTRRPRVDGKGVRSATDYFGGWNVVLFVPDDLRLVRGAPAERRRFLDRAVWNAQPSYLAEAQTYDRILRSRNACLRDAERVRQTGELLDVFDAQLARAGAVLMRRRRAYLAELAPRVQAAHERITRSGLGLEVRYDPALADDSATTTAPGTEALAEALATALRASRPRDLRRGFTGPGPHGDDLALALGGRPARLHASQGQTRAIVLALKIAEIEHLYAVLGEPPVLLLDDVSSELDAERTRYLLDFVAGLGCQALLSTTSPDHLPLPADRADFRVLNGEVRG